MIRQHLRLLLQFVISAFSIIMFIVSIAVLEVPVMGVDYIQESESSDIIIRGYNLMEYSIYGFVVILAPIIMLNIQYSNMSCLRLIVAISSIAFSSCLCYILALINGCNWLTTIQTDINLTYWSIDYYWGQWAIPLCTVMQSVAIIFRKLIFVAQRLSKKI